MGRHQPKKGDLLLMVGTRKGAFLFWSDPGRIDWNQSFHHQGWMVHSLAYQAETQTLFTATNNEVYGALVQRTQDFGESWTHQDQKLDYPGDWDYRVRKVWQVEVGHSGKLYAGVERAGLFVSEDQGDNWREIKALNLHEHSPQWQPGAGGLCLHTILEDPSDPDRVYVAISTGGIYRTENGGATWEAKNNGVRADFLPEPFPEFGQCVHKVAFHPAKPEVLYQQNHCGVYRSDDRGENWQDISEGLPSRFGFPCAIHAHDPDTVYVIPLSGDGDRVIPEGKLTVWRSADRGETWKPLQNGLPENAYLSVLRDAIAVDACDISGVFLGPKPENSFTAVMKGILGRS
jgi:photosystem II stability/assembly factor-like uncharacterized protein